MTKIPPYQYSEWEGYKANFPFIIEIHIIPVFFKSHRHNCIEFHYVIEGSGYELINDVTYPLEPGSFILILPYQVHEFHCNNKEGLRIYNISLKLDLLFGTDKLNNDINAMLFNNVEELPPYVKFPVEAHEKLLDIFSEIKYEFNNDFIWHDLLFISKLIEILVLFDRKRRSEVTNVMAKSSQIKSKSIWDVVYYIHNHYAEEITLRNLSSHFHLNASYLSTLFKKTLGKSFLDFLNEIRILHSCRLLSTTGLPITQIAYEAGFKSYSSFSRVFQEHKNMSAAAYRKLNFSK